MISARKQKLLVNDALPQNDTPEELRVFQNGKFLFAAFEYGREMVIDLSAGDLKTLEALLFRIMPLPA